MHHRRSSLVRDVDCRGFPQKKTPQTIDNGDIHVIYTYNTNGDIASYTAKYQTTTLYTYALTYFNDGRIATNTETIQGTMSTYAYMYDAAGRLSTVTKALRTARRLLQPTMHKIAC